jgi:ribonuclease HI
MIMGAMKTTATDTVEVMANLIPFQLLVEKHRHQAAIRLATLPESHPLHKPVINAAKTLVKHHPTPLHDLMHRYSIQPQGIETIKAVRFDTKWKPKISTHIANNVDEALENMQQDRADVKVFTDGSGMEGRIGAAAVLYQNGRMKTRLRYQLGSQHHHTVYEGEGIGAVLGTKLISNEWGVRSAIFYIDNQASITATQLTNPTSGHHIFDAFHDCIEALKKKHSRIHLQIKWVPGHKGVDENEQADKQAKKAITEGSSDRSELPRHLKKTLPYSKSAMKWAYNEKLKRRAQKIWQKSPRFERMRKTDPTTPSDKYITNLLRKVASILTQLRTGHAPLAKHLHRIGKNDSPICPACQQGEESIQHFLLHCPAHQKARQTMRNNTGGRDINITKLLTTPRTLRALFKFVAETGRFHNTFRELPMLAEEPHGER